MFVYLLLFVSTTLALPRFLMLESADEGMSSWRHALCEFFAIAIQLNATIAEPCVVAGRIRPCTALHAQPLSMLYDTSLVEREFGLQFISASAFTEMAKRIPMGRIARWSMHAGTPRRPDHSLHGVPWTHFVTTIRDCDMVTLFHFRKYSRCTTTFADTVARLQQILPFARSHSEFVDRLIAQMFANRSYAAVHWRSEVACRDYQSCAALVLRVKNRLCLGNPRLCPPLGPPVLLISDLTANHSASSWRVMRTYLETTNQVETAHRAYETLLAPSSGFVKIDSFLHTEEEQKSSFRPIWDLLLGAHASVLLSCVETCDAQSLCSAQRCAWQGNFARHLKELRESFNHSPVSCW